MFPFDNSKYQMNIETSLYVKQQRRVVSSQLTVMDGAYLYIQKLKVSLSGETRHTMHDYWFLIKLQRLSKHINMAVQ